MNVIVFGLPGSGKTYFADRLASKINGLHISSDTVRNHMQQQLKYHDQAKMEVYHKMLKLMEKAISNKQNIVLDATYYKENIRNLFKQKATLLNSKIYFIEIRANKSVIKERLDKKRNESEADFNVYLKIKSTFEPLRERHLILHSDKEGLNEMLNKALVSINFSDGRATDQKLN